MADNSFRSSSPMSASSSDETLADQPFASTVSKEQNQSISSPRLSSAMEDVPLLLEEALGQPIMINNTPPNPAPSARSMPRLNTRSSLSGPSLPWQVDTTSSPSTPSSYGRKASFVPPPRPDTGSYVPHAPSSPSLPQLQPDTPISSSPYRHPSLYASRSGPVIDRSHPPGYSQDAQASFSDWNTYGNHSPFYENNHSSSFSSPITPTRRGRGILDNDPAIYLQGEGDGEDDSMWDTAAKWAKAAGKRLSQGEQQIWKLVSAIGNSDMER